MAGTYDETNAPFQHLVKYCCDKYYEFKESTYRKRKLEEARKSRMIYAQEAEATAEPWEGAANVVLPLTVITVDNMEPRLVAGLVSQSPTVRLEIDGQAQLTPEEESLQDWWDNELHDIVKIDDIASSVCHDVQLDGTVFVMPRYDVTEKTIRLMQMVDQQAVQQGAMQLQKLSQIPPDQLPPEIQAQAQQIVQQLQTQSRNVNGILVDESGRPAWKDQTVREFEGGRVEFLKISDVFMADDVDDEDYEDALIIRKVSPTYAELMRESADQSAKGWVTANITAGLLGEQTEEPKLEAEAQSPAQDIASVEVSGKQVITCIECYVSYIYREPGQNESDATEFEEERLVALITEQTKKLLRVRLLRDLNPMNNHVIRRLTLIHERGESLGCTVASKMKSIQEGASKAFNLAINTGESSLIPWGFYDRKSGLQKLQGEKGQLQIKLGQMLPVDDVNGIKWPQMNGNYAGFIQIMELWMRFWERIFNIGDLQIGRPKGDTATETLAVIQEGNVSHNYRSKRSKTGFLGLIQTLWDLYFAWMPLDKTIKVDGKDQPLPRQLMARGFKLRLTSSSEMANKLIQRRETEDLANMTGVTKMPQLWNQIKVAEELVKAYGKDAPEEYVNPQLGQLTMLAMQMPQVIPAMMAAAQQAIQMAAQMTAAGQAKGKGLPGNGATPPEGQAPGPPTGEAMAPKFAPHPNDVVKPLGV